MVALSILAVLLAGTPSWNTYPVTVATADCPPTPVLGSPGTNPLDGETYGISLSNLQSWSATICAPAGQTIDAISSIKVCLYSAQPWGPGLWMESTELLVTPDVPEPAPRCITLADREVKLGLSNRVYLAPIGVILSGGTQVTVYHYGEGR